MTITAASALWFLPFALPICVWVAWNDMKFMKIPNKAVMALVLVFLVIGPIALSFEEYLWRWTHLIVVLVIGFAMNMTRLIGAGDAKFAAAMAPFIALGDLQLFLFYFAFVVVVSFLLHRLVRRIPAVTQATPDLLSWTSPKFPMGLSLGTGLAIYLAFGVFHGA